MQSEDAVLGDGLRRRAAHWEFAHLVAAAATAVLTLLIAFAGDGAARYAVGLLYGLGCVLGFLVAALLRVAILDILGQFQYREKFALFLIHVLAMGIPKFFGVDGWQHAFGLLLVMIAPQCVNAVVFGRFAAISAFIVVMRLTGAPAVPSPFVILWMLVWLLCFRFEHVRFKLEAHGGARGIPASAARAQTLGSVVLPWGLALVLTAPLAILWHGRSRVLTFHGPRGGLSPMGPVSTSDVMWTAITLIAMVIGSILLIAWIEKQLRALRKGDATLGEGAAAMLEGREARVRATPSGPQWDDGTDARGRIVARFGRFAEELERLGEKRFSGETAAAYLARSAFRFQVAAAAAKAAPVFDAACYSHKPMTDAAAGEFDDWMSATETEARRRLDPQIAPEAPK